MKHFRFFVIGASMVSALAVRADLVSGVSVVVDDQVITYGEIADKVEPLLSSSAAAMGSQHFDEEARRVRDQEIENLVERKLILHSFNTGGTVVTNALEAFVDDRIKKIVQERTGGDMTRFKQTLHAQGRTFEMFRREVKEDIIVGYEGYHNAGDPQKIIISPLKIEEYYKEHPEAFKVSEQVKIRMIVISKADDTQGEGRKTADQVLAKINQGASFAELANEYQSSSHRGDTNGGERGWVDRTYFKPELADVAFSLKAGEHSGVIELPEACYLLLVEDKRAAHVNSLAEVRTDIEKTLLAEEHARLRQRWINRLKNKSFVQYH